MASIPTSQITLPKTIVDTLSEQAKAMGMSLESYVTYLVAKRRGGLDVTFDDAVKHVFTTFGDDLRKLAE